MSTPSTRSLLPSLLLLICQHQATDAFSPLSGPQHNQKFVSPSIALNSKEPSDWSDNAAALAGPSYSDDLLMNFHNQGQDEMQGITNNLAVWNEELQNEQMRILEWQDSFRRNGVADFTPPMSNGLNCLMVGGEGLGGEHIKLPWEDEAEANVTPLYITDDYETTSVMVSSPETPPSPPVAPIVQTAPEASTESPTNSNVSTALTVADPNKAAAVYDCIVDQGLLDAVVALGDKAATRQLLIEAATAIREHGIYVFVARDLSDETRVLLEDCSEVAGLEWEFGLDGISNDSQVVSVARRYNSGEMPKVGRLSRFQVN